MSESAEISPAPGGEVISTPGADMIVPDGVPTKGMSERKQARRENWRLIRRRPAFVVGVLISVFWLICAVLGDRITPHHPLDYRTKAHLSPRLCIRSAPTTRGATCCRV